jgi:hypothetical protein
MEVNFYTTMPHMFLCLHTTNEFRSLCTFVIGFEFVRRETYTDVNDILDQNKKSESIPLEQSNDDDSLHLAKFPDLSVQFSTMSSKEKQKNAVVSASELPKQATLFQAIYALQGGVHIEDYFDLICSGESYMQSNRSSCELPF